jgi:hypothetical protein
MDKAINNRTYLPVGASPAPVSSDMKRPPAKMQAVIDHFQSGTVLERMEMLFYIWGGEASRGPFHERGQLLFAKARHSALDGENPAKGRGLENLIKFNTRLHAHLAANLQAPGRLGERLDGIAADSQLSYAQQKNATHRLLRGAMAGQQFALKTNASKQEVLAVLQRLLGVEGGISSTGDSRAMLGSYTQVRHDLEADHLESLTIQSVEHRDPGAEFQDDVIMQLVCLLPESLQQRWNDLLANWRQTPQDALARRWANFCKEALQAPAMEMTGLEMAIKSSGWPMIATVDATGGNGAGAAKSGQPPRAAPETDAPDRHSRDAALPPNLAWLAALPTALRNAPEWPAVVARMKKYDAAMTPARGEPNTVLCGEIHRGDAIRRMVRSLRIYSCMPPEFARRMALTRSLTNILGVATPARLNEEVLGNARSLALQKDRNTGRSKKRKTGQSRTTDVDVMQSGNQVSIAVRIPMLDSRKNASRKTVWPLLLSIPAAALDSPTQPEWRLYVDHKGNLDEALFRNTMQTLCAHVTLCSDANPRLQVALSAAGLNNFLAALAPPQKARALEIGAEEYARLASALTARGRHVSYIDITPDSRFWNDVGLRAETVLAYAGAIPGSWISKDILLVNAWDPHSLMGNGCNLDRSIDGAVGAHSLCHDFHALLCILEHEKLLDRLMDVTSHIVQTRPLDAGD